MGTKVGGRNVDWQLLYQLNLSLVFTPVGIWRLERKIAVIATLPSKYEKSFLFVRGVILGWMKWSEPSAQTWKDTVISNTGLFSFFQGQCTNSTVAFYLHASKYYHVNYDKDFLRGLTSLDMVCSIWLLLEQRAISSGLLELGIYQGPLNTWEVRMHWKCATSALPEVPTYHMRMWPAKSLAGLKVCTAEGLGSNRHPSPEFRTTINSQKHNSAETCSMCAK